MNNHWHEQLQRYLDGTPDAAETAALEAALNQDAELRALYLDYINLDVALDAAAAAPLTEHGSAGTAPFPRLPASPAVPWGRWLAAAAACAAGVILVLLPGPRGPARPGADITAACAATQTTIARLSMEPPAPFPEWASPTFAMLDEPQLSK